jgi:hypothetical protein
MRLRCPTCSRPILSRRNKLCSFCQKPLPAELLFTLAEVEMIEAAEAERKLLRELRQEERVKEILKRSINDGGGGGFF